MALDNHPSAGDQDHRYKVMVVDDSAVIRGLLTRALEQDPAIEVSASVSNGDLAVKANKKNEFDVIVLDIEMPVMDGLTALPLLLADRPKVRVIVASTLTRKNAEISIKALQLGASDYLAKPQSGTELTSAENFKRELVAKVKALARSASGRKVAGAAAPARAPIAKSPAVPSKPASAKPAIALRSTPFVAPDAIAIASSTGGPQALLEVVKSFPSGIKLPLFITQHMPATFTSILAQHLTRASGLDCQEGKEGEVVLAGRVYVAPGDYHMAVELEAARPTIRLLQTPPENYCRPSADPMLRSLIKVYGGRLLLVVLTGMGADGLGGARDLVAAGGTVVAQDEESSVVWGMPGAVANAGLCSEVFPLQEIGPFIKGHIMRSAA